MSDLKQLAASAHIFHHASDIELKTSPPSTVQREQGKEDLHGSLLELGDELNMSPLRRVVSRVERREIGSVYFAASGKERTLAHEGELEYSSADGAQVAQGSREPIQAWEVWATDPMWSKRSAQRDTQLSATDLFFEIREARAERWNEVLLDHAHFRPLSHIEETPLLLTEVYLEDTITASDSHDIEALRSSLADTEVVDTELLEKRAREAEERDQENTKSVESHDPDHDELSSDSGQVTYQVRCAPINLQPLKLTPLTAIELPATTSSLDESADTSHFDSADLSSFTHTLAVSVLRELLEPMYPLFQLINRLHSSGQCLGGFDPTLFGVVSALTDAEQTVQRENAESTENAENAESAGSAEGKERTHGDDHDNAHDRSQTSVVRPRYPLHLYQVTSDLNSEQRVRSLETSQAKKETLTVANHPAVQGREVSVYAGYSPPEMYGYYQGVPSPQSDVFSAGMMIYYALTGCPRFIETMRPFSKLPSPHVYRQDLSPEIVSVVYRAISPNPSRRHLNMSALLSDLAWALEVAELREARQATPLRVEAGHEIHVGLLKGQYNPVNQDDLFLGYQSDLDVGLFVVTDGVSICEHGSGDLASGLVREEAAQRWREICRAPVVSDDDEETISEINLIKHPDTPRRHEKVLTTLVNRANRRIGDYINQMIPTFHGPPEGIMAATAVAALVTGGVAMLTSVGDSRIYLIRDGHIMNLMYDEDLYTHLLQAKQSPSQAQQSPSAAALVHCIGEFSKDSNHQLKASPISPQLREIKLLPGDQLVLCSDGIPDYAGVDEEDAELRILECVESALTVHHAAFELIALANRGGGGDNLSCIVLKFSERGVRRGVAHV